MCLDERHNKATNGNSNDRIARDFSRKFEVNIQWVFHPLSEKNV